MNIISGIYNDNSIRVGIVASRFNEIIVSKLMEQLMGFLVME